MPRIYVAGHKGMVGSAICRQLNMDQTNVIITASKSDLDLTKQSEVLEFIADQEIDHVYLAAAKVGGIHANDTYPAEFIYENLMIQTNVIDASYKAGVDKLLFLGSSCIYPRDAQQPMVETSLLTAKLEPTNEPYAVAKIAGIKMCESYNRQYGVDFRSVMPTNLYGCGDNFHLSNSHVIPALIKKFHDAKKSGMNKVVVWGSGSAKREFLHVDDMAQASVFVMNIDKDILCSRLSSRNSHINIGTGLDCTISHLAEIIKETIGYTGDIFFDRSKPDGPPRKLLDTSLLTSLGWEASVTLRDGLERTYEWYKSSINRHRLT
jgi:GDP-L-fucose synthase